MPPPKFTVGDLATREGMESFVTGHVFDRARFLFEEHGTVCMLADLICTIGGADFPLKPGAIGVQTLVINGLPNTTAKDVVAHAIGKRAKTVGAIGVVLSMEAWLLRGTDEEGLEFARRHGVQAHPGRVEGVFVSCEHIQFGARWTALISRDAAGNGTLGSFERDERPGVDVEGRFVGLLRRDGFS